MNAASEINSRRETFAGLYEEYLPKVFRYVRYRAPAEVFASLLV